MPSYCSRLRENFRKEVQNFLILKVVASILAASLSEYGSHYFYSQYKTIMKIFPEGEFHHFSFLKVLSYICYINSTSIVMGLIYYLYSIFKRSRAIPIGIQQDTWAHRNPNLPEIYRSHPQLSQPDEVEIFDILSSSSSNIEESIPNRISSISRSSTQKSLSIPSRAVTRLTQRSVPNPTQSSARSTTRQIQRSTLRSSLDLRRSRRLAELNTPRSRRSQQHQGLDADIHLHM